MTYISGFIKFTWILALLSLLISAKKQDTICLISSMVFDMKIQLIWPWKQNSRSILVIVNPDMLSLKRISKGRLCTCNYRYKESYFNSSSIWTSFLCWLSNCYASEKTNYSIAIYVNYLVIANEVSIKMRKSLIIISIFQPVILNMKS